MDNLNNHAFKYRSNNNYRCQTSSYDTFKSFCKCIYLNYNSNFLFDSGDIFGQTILRWVHYEFQLWLNKYRLWNSRQLDWIPLYSYYFSSCIISWYIFDVWNCLCTDFYYHFYFNVFTKLEKLSIRDERIRNDGIWS